MHRIVNARETLSVSFVDSVHQIGKCREARAGYLNLFTGGRSTNCAHKNVVYNAQRVVPLLWLMKPSNSRVMVELKLDTDHEVHRNAIDLGLSIDLYGHLHQPKPAE